MLPLDNPHLSVLLYLLLSVLLSVLLSALASVLLSAIASVPWWEAASVGAGVGGGGEVQVVVVVACRSGRWPGRAKVERDVWEVVQAS